jgi:hypothetical protein
MIITTNTFANIIANTSTNTIDSTTNTIITTITIAGVTNQLDVMLQMIRLLPTEPRRVPLMSK